LSQRLLDQLLPYFHKAFEPYPEVTWELTMVILPDASHDQFSAFLGLYTEIPGTVLNTTIRANTMLNPSGQTQESITSVAQSVHEGLLNGRSKQLKSMEDQAMDASENGKPNPISGLIIP
jgi:hypothetical protein